MAKSSNVEESIDNSNQTSENTESSDVVNQASGPLKQVRMLVDHVDMKCGKVYELPDFIATDFISQGIADGHPDAVAYAKENG